MPVKGPDLLNIGVNGMTISSVAGLGLSVRQGLPVLACIAVINMPFAPW